MTTFFKIKNKPFHFLFVFIFACMTTKPIFASPMESSSSLSKEEFILGDENSLYLEKKEGLWHLMICEGSSLCREVETNDVDKIAHHLEDLRPHLDDYCSQGKEDYLCKLFALSLELTQRKRDRNISGVMIGVWAVALAIMVFMVGTGPAGWTLTVVGVGAGAVLGWALVETEVEVLVVAGAGTVGWALAMTRTWAGAGSLAIGAITGAMVGAGKTFLIEQEDIKKIRMELSKILEENAQNDFGFTEMP